MTIYNIISLIGIFALMAIAHLFAPRALRFTINWRLVAWALALQMLFALFVFTFPAGTALFLWLNDIVLLLLDAAAAGSRFVFGTLALPPGTSDAFGQQSIGFILAFQALPTILFFSALIAILYHIGVMSRVIQFFARIFTRLMGISGAESLAASSNIFVGVESALTIRPYLNRMTHSELNTVLTAGMATVSSNVLALYVFALQGSFPSIAGHLISASILSAPAAILISKLVLPESGRPVTLGEDITIDYQRESSIFEAILEATRSGVAIIVGIVALLIAVLGLVELFDLILGGIGSRITLLFGIEFELSLRALFALLFYPLTLLLGVPIGDAWLISGILGERLVVTEVGSYMHLGQLVAAGQIADGRSVVIATYALCGFAHFASMAIFVGGVAAVADEKRREIAAIGWRALVGATFATLMTGAVAGMFYFGDGLVVLP